MSEPRKPDETSQEPAETAVDGVGIVSLLISGMAVWGGAGWLLDRLTGYQALFLPIGILLGMGLALYMVFAKLHARPKQPPSPGPTAVDGASRDGREDRR